MSFSLLKVWAGFLFYLPMLLPYTKTFLDLPDLLALLKSRGLIVADDVAATECLHRTGYYRLSAYWYPFREIVSGARIDKFLPGSHFEDAIKLYDYDKEFKLLLLDALECVEIGLRIETAALLGKRNMYAHEDRNTFSSRFTHPVGSSSYDTWINKFQSNVARSQAPFVVHFRTKYGRSASLPIWVAVELWDFGLLSYAFSGLRIADQKTLAQNFLIPRGDLLKSWVRSLNYVRNVIAHHSRLWNSNIVDVPELPTLGEMAAFDPLLTISNASTRVYAACCILSHLMSVISPKSPWKSEMTALFKRFPTMPYANLQDMGIPPDWETHSFWL